MRIGEEDMDKIAVKLLMLCGLLVGIQPVVFADCPEGTLLAIRTYLDQDKRQARRLILEPGSVLKCTGAKGKKLVVRTTTGITGSISKDGVHIVTAPSFNLAYPKTRFRAQSGRTTRWFYPGQFYPYREDPHSGYVLTIGEARYNVGKGEYEVETFDFVLDEKHLDKFNFVDHDTVQEAKFPEWRKIRSKAFDFTQQWGCGKSISQKLAADAKVEGSLSVGGGLLSWIKGKFGLSASASGDIEIQDEKKDENKLHTLTSWDLIGENQRSIMTLIVERYHACGRGSDEPINYKFHFPRDEFDEIIIDKAWAKTYEFPTGGAVPVRLSTVDDFFRFSSNLADHYNLTGDYAEAIRDFVIFSAVNIR